MPRTRSSPSSASRGHHARPWRRTTRTAQPPTRRSVGQGGAARRPRAGPCCRAGLVTGQRIIAVDGGASKTDLAIVRDDGTLLAAMRGPGSNPHHIGVDGCVELIADLHARAVATAGPDPLPAHAVYVLAGADLPEEEATLQAEFAARGWSA